MAPAQPNLFLALKGDNGPDFTFYGAYRSKAAAEAALTKAGRSDSEDPDESPYKLIEANIGNPTSAKEIFVAFVHTQEPAGTGFIAADSAKAKIQKTVAKKLGINAKIVPDLTADIWEFKSEDVKEGEKGYYVKRFDLDMYVTDHGQLADDSLAAA